MTRTPSQGGPPTGVPGDQPQPSNQPIDESTLSVPLETEDGEEVVVGQSNVGYDNMAGGGEWPDPDAPARGPAPGTTPPAGEERGIPGPGEG